MKILHLNKFFWSAGGIERYLFDVSAMQRRAGHETIFFSMRNPKNQDCAQAKYFVSPIEYRNTSVGYKLATLPRTIGKSIYSFESKRNLRALIEAERPDIAHVHLITHQISPSVLDTLCKAHVPTVLTIHEYSLVCPSGRRYIEALDEPCDRCLGGNYLNAIRHRCIQGRTLPSILAAGAHCFHTVSGIYLRGIDLFIAPNAFTAETARLAGVPAERIRHLPMAIDLSEYRPEYAPGNYAVYFGRLSPEKGVMTLLEAASLTPEIDVRIVGDGPDRDRLKGYAEKNGLRNVTFCGYKAGENLRDSVRGAFAAVVPSTCYDNSPLAILEAQALGKPVIASRIGGIPDLIDVETGFLVPAGNPEALAERLRACAEDSALCETAGRAARRRVQMQCDRHEAALAELYQSAIDMPRSK